MEIGKWYQSNDESYLFRLDKIKNSAVGIQLYLGKHTIDASEMRVDPTIFGRSIYEADKKFMRKFIIDILEEKRKLRDWSRNGI